jgi:hypothetical protein
MARTYWTRCPATAVDGEPLDAWTARTRVQANAEAVFEEARVDQCVVFEPEEPGVLTPVGPFPVWMRRDRDQRWRPPRVSPCFSAGSAAIVLRATLTWGWHRPTVSGGAVDELPYLDWSVGLGSTPAWQTAGTFSIPVTWDPERREIPEGDEAGGYRLAWLSFWVTTAAPGPTKPSLVGFRLEETVDDEP